MQRFTTHLALAALAALALLPSRLAAAEGYAITDLGGLSSAPYSSVWQQTINNDGQVAAYANSNASFILAEILLGDSVFVWKNGQTTPLPGLPNAIDTIASSLNNQGQVVGRSRPSGEFHHAVLWDHGVIQTLGELSGDNRSNALTINDRGMAVGYSQNTGLGTRRAVTWYKGNVSQLTPLVSGPTFDIAFGINAPGQIVGSSGPDVGPEHAALWDKAGVHDLGTLGGPSSDAVAINNKGQVVGFSDTTLGSSDAFLWVNGVMTDLGVFGDDTFSVAFDINNNGQIVGFSGGSFTDPFPSRALLWENGGVTNLQTKIPATSGWALQQALGINNRGEIVGIGLHDGNPRAFLLTPTKRHDE